MANDVMTSSYGAVKISEGMQGPNLSRLGSEISSARAADVSPGAPGVGLSPGQGMLILFADMRDSLLTIQENTLETAQLIKDSVIPLLGGTPAQQRDDDISKGETDKKDSRGFGDRLRGIGNALDKVNPFSSGFAFGNIGRALLAGGGLILLKVFGENLIGPLAKLLETIKKAEIGEMLTGEDGIITNIKENLVKAFEEVKKAVVSFIEAVTLLKNLVVSIYTAINDYVMQFDVDKDGKLNEEEFGFLKEDIKDKTVKLLSDFFGDLFLSLGGALLGASFLGFTTKKLLAHPTIQNIFSFKKAPVQPMLPGMGGGAAAAGGMSALASTLGIGALILAGVTLTYQNVNRSLAKTLEENNNEFAASNFFANFFGGDDEGGVMNALKQAFLVGGTGILAVTGAQGIIAAFMGLGAVGGPPGIIAGGLIGLAVAGTIGLISGLVGSDKLEAGFKRIGEDFNNTVNSITSFFSNLIKGIKSYIKTGDYSLAFESDIGQLEAKKMTLQEEYNKSYGELQEQLQRQARGKPTIGLGFLKKQTRELAEELKEVDAQIENQPIRAAEAAAGITLETIDDNIDQAQTNIDFITNQKATTSTATPGYKDLMMRFDNDIAAQQAIIDENLAKRSMIMGTSVNIEKSNMMLEKFGRTRTDLQYSPGYIRPEDRAQAVVVSGNSTNSNNTQTSNYSLGGLTVGNSDAETRALVESRF